MITAWLQALPAGPGYLATARSIHRHPGQVNFLLEGAQQTERQENANYLCTVVEFYSRHLHLATDFWRQYNPESDHQR